MSEFKLSAVVIAQNCAPAMERCLSSLRFADEIVVVDGLSHDGTPEVARRLGARVILNRWPGFARQKQFAIDQAAAEWVFLCDTDEEVPTELADEITETVAMSSAADGYRVRRRNQFLGEWIDVGPWTSDLALRLFKKGRGKIIQTAVHEGVFVEGSIRTLSNSLNHYTHPTVADSIARLNRYTSLESRDRVDRRRVYAIDPLLPLIGVFGNYFLAKGCWRAGMRGFLLSAITAMYKSVLYMKIYLLQRPQRKV